MSAENLRDTIVPKSDQLNADDLLAGPITVTVTSVRRGSEDQPVIIEVTGQRPYKPCKSMRRVLIAAWGDDGRAWVGRSMTLYADPEVKFGGVKVGGIRISHMSDIEQDLCMALTATKGKRTPYTVRMLTTYDDAKFAAELPKMLAAIASGKSTAEKIVAHCEKTAPLTAGQRAQLAKQAATDEETF